MKTKAILLASVLLVGCQATQNTGSQQQTHNGSAVLNQNRLLSQTDDTPLTPAADQDLWAYIRGELKMEIADNHRVREQREFYLSKKSYLHNVLLRADPYIYWIAEQVQKRRMPMELVLLPIVESAFNPYAKSPAKAAGIWQIIPSTGRNYGLKQTRGYDARYDIAASTSGALDILQRLNNMFDGDWLLTIAAYNSGEGRVLKAMKDNAARGKPVDFWSLQLPQETKEYVPRLLALTDIFKHSQRYGLSLPQTNSNRALVQVAINAPITVEQIAQITGIETRKLKAFNAGIKGSIYGLHDPQYVMVPRKYAHLLEKALDNGDFMPVSATLLANNRINTATGSAAKKSQSHYKVQTNDTLSGIAARLGVKVKDLQSWNQLRSSAIKAGQTLVVNNTGAANKRKTSLSVAHNSIIYKVRKGDSLYSIARRHGVKIEDLKRWNNSSGALHPGDQLTLYVRN